MNFRIFATLLLVTFSLIANAATYYVSPTGTSSTGTIDNPMSFATANAKSLVAGDIVILRGGTYSFSSSVTLSKSGSSSAYVKYTAYEGEVPVFDFRNQPYNSSNIGVKVSGNYIHVRGIIIQGAGDNGMQVTGSNNLIDFCTFRWNCDSGLQMKTGSSNTILNCDSYENFDYMTGGTSAPDFGGNADGFADKQYTNTGTNTYRGCRSWKNSDDAWDHYEKIGNTVYYDCWSFSNGPASFDMTDHIRYNTDKTWIDAVSTTTSGRKYIKNYGNGNGFKLGGNYTAHNATLYNCVAVQNTVKGFDQNNNDGTMTLYNCTGYLNNPDYGFSNSSYGSLVVRNSASLGTKSSNKFTAKTNSSTYNTWNSGFSCTTADFVSLDHTALLLPRQADGALPVSTFLHLKPTSVMIDKGTNVGISFLGTAPDLGAYEYNANTAVFEIDDNSELHAYYAASENKIVFVDAFKTAKAFNLYGQKITEISSLNQDVISTQGWTKGIYVVIATNTENKNVSLKILIR